jgi:predicted ATPase/DNA-binding XRE family transcriptional regulator
VIYRRGSGRRFEGRQAVGGEGEFPFGRELRVQRRAAGLSQEALAERAGISTDAIAALERGRRRQPRAYTVRALSDALGLGAAAAARLQDALERDPSPAPLPERVRPMIGRDDERHRLVDLLSGPARTVTLTGPGGVGKTRLALSVAHHLAESGRAAVHWIWLGPVSDPQLVPTAIATAIGARDVPDADPIDAVVERIGAVPTVLVLDNCEHLVDAIVAWCATLLARTQVVRVLATSREPLGIMGELVRPVAPLPVPPGDVDPAAEELRSWPATRLFLDRAEDAVPDFTVDEGTAASIAQVCRGLDGLPLAIELAAARMNALSAGQLAHDLDASLRTATGPRTAPDRHRTLDAAIGWSYDLLEPAEQALLARPSVASLGWTVEAAQQFAAGGIVLADDVLGLMSELVRKSLLVLRTRDGLGRYAMLRVIKLHAAERLATSGEEAAARERHARYFTELAERAGAGLRGPDQQRWLDRLDAETNNIRAALRYWREAGAADEGLRTATALWRFAYLRGRYAEGRDALHAALQVADAAPGADPVLRAGALVAAGTLAYLQCEYDEGARLVRDGLARYRAAGEVGGVADALQRLGSIARERGAYEEAVALHEEGLALRRAAGDRVGVGDALNYLAFVAWLTGDPECADRLATEALTEFRGTDEGEGVAWSLLNAGISARYRDAPAQAEELLRECLELCEQLGYAEGTAWCLDQLGAVAREREQLDRAWELQQESLTIHAEVGDRWRAASVLDGLAVTAARRSWYEAATRLLGTADALRAAIGTPRPPCEGADYDAAVASVVAALGTERYADLARVARPERMLARLAETADLASVLGP